MRCVAVALRECCSCDGRAGGVAWRREVRCSCGVRSFRNGFKHASDVGGVSWAERGRCLQDTALLVSSSDVSQHVRSESQKLPLEFDLEDFSESDTTDR